MKLLEALPNLLIYIRIRRKDWEFYLIRSEYYRKGLIKIDLESMQLCEYMLTIDDLLADDWEIVQ